MSLNSETAIIIPVFNEGKVIRAVINSVLKHFSQVICINDGSTDNTTQEIVKTKALLINHPINLGQGAAIQTGIQYALQNPEVEYFITFDADGQHNLNDAKKMLDHLKKNNLDIVLGSRFLGTAKNIPATKRVLLKAAVRFSNITTGLKLTDAHNGLRVFNRHVAETLNITMPDMAHASEILHKIAKNKYKYAELPVTISYSEYSKAKGQSMLNAINISFDLLINKVSKK